MIHALLPIIFFVTTVLFAASAGEAATFPLTGTKHDLSSAGTGSYKAKTPALGGTTEKCIFCHTPHSANMDAPLWNRATNLESYVTYTSDVLGVLGYPTAEDPNTGPGSVAHAKTRICLSCHDGTIALGSVVNMPNTMAGSEILMDGNARIVSAAAGYIGIQMQDDHPVAIKHDQGRDPELISGTSGGGVRLYKTAGGVENADGNYVECTSCHEPHNNQYGNFLVAPNTGSELCKKCHTKTGFALTSIHDSAAANDSYSPPDGKGGSLSTDGTVSGVECMLCHFPHKAGIVDTSSLPAASPNLTGNPKAGYYLLAFQEEMTCFNNTNRWGQSVAVCHGTNASALPNQNIQLVENSNATLPRTRHWTQDPGTVGRHEATEGRTQGWLNNGANWHVECADCHNAHTAGATNHTAGTNAVTVTTSPLYGAGGVSMPGSPRTWGGLAGSGYTYREPLGVINTGNFSVLYEYEICFKCHTDWAWGAIASNAPNSPSLGIPMTDQAMEFNTANASFHPVVGVNPSTQGTLLNNWLNPNQTMYCSDCHSKENGSRPLGPHGSNNAFILAKSYNDNYTPTVSYVQSSALGVSDDLCFNCHSESVYQSGAAGLAGTGFSGPGVNLHTQHRIRAPQFAQSTFGYRCVNCHTRVSHGFNRKAMVVLQGEGAPYEAGGTNQGKIAGLVGALPASGSYAVGVGNKNATCNTVNGCHQ